MNRPSFGAIKEVMTLSSNEKDQLEGTITSYTGSVNHLLRYHRTDAVALEANKEVYSFN